MNVKFFFAGAVFLGAASPILASSLQDTHTFRAGAYYQDIDIDAALTRKPFDEIEINFDSVLGMDDSATTLFAGYNWRFSEKWALGIYYSNMSADGSRSASRDFVWDGQEYQAGARIDSELELDTFLATANYSFARNDKYEWGLGVGLHAFDIETTFDARLGVSGVVEEARRSNSTVLAPLPNIRAYGTWALTPKWEINFDLGWLSLNYDDYEGDYLFFHARTEYRFTERFGAGISFQAAEIDVEVDRRRGNDSFDIDLYGPSLYLTYGF